MWNVAKTLWDVYLSNVDANKVIQYIAAIATYRSGIFKVMPQANIRSNWQIYFNNEMRKMTIPCITATVAPPNVLPIMMDIRDTGATRVSFKNPNCLSQIISMPINIAVKRIPIAMMPGARNCMYSPPPAF